MKSMDFGLISFENPDALYTRRKHTMAPGWKLEGRSEEGRLVQNQCDRHGRNRRTGKKRLFPCDPSENVVYGKNKNTSPELVSLQRTLVDECKARPGCKARTLL